MVARLRTENETQIEPVQLTKMWTVTGQSVFNNNHFKVGMLSMELTKKSLSGVARTVVFLFPVPVANDR